MNEEALTYWGEGGGAVAPKNKQKETLMWKVFGHPSSYKLNAGTPKRRVL